MTSGLHDAIARLIQRQLGFPGRNRLRAEARRLTAVVLSGVSSGSTVLEFEVLPISGISGRHPTALAAFDLVNGIRSFSDSSSWPDYLPAVVRNCMALAVAPILATGASVDITVEEEGTAASCKITESTKIALQVPERFEPAKPVEVVGRIFAINRSNNSFKVDTVPKKVNVRVSESQFKEVDRLRWERVFLSGFPEDESCKLIHDVDNLRLATDLEEDGISLPSELRRGEKTEAYRQAAERADSLRLLEDGWDTYQARSPERRSLDFALQFLRDSIGMLLDYGIELPTPFLVPTPSGGVQLEWKVLDRELELEVLKPSRFEFLAVDGERESEGTASRWMATRLIRWVITGEEV
ncbi:MAG: hypothetical protein WAM82_29245 [Thermoanaerobaculia bacterium]